MPHSAGAGHTLQAAAAPAAAEHLWHSFLDVNPTAVGVLVGLYQQVAEVLSKGNKFFWQTNHYERPIHTEP